MDPGADATLGGMTATGASGTTAVRYGTMSENVRGLTVVLADGRAITTGGRARKSSAGYDLTRLFVGSEGTLGIISEITVRLQPLPEAVAAAVCSFPSIDSAVKTVIATIQLGVPVARIELLDEVQMDAINRFSKLDYPVLPTLFFEFHGSHRARGRRPGRDRAVAGRRERRDPVSRGSRARKTGRVCGGPATTPTTLRSPSGLAPRRWTTDACVPISRLAECIVESKRDLDESSLTGTLVGHVGDGNFHMLYLVDPDSPEEMAEARRLNERLVHRAMEMGGTCSGEHGVGIGKMRYLAREHGEALDTMRAIKQALDPRGLMNPERFSPDDRVTDRSSCGPSAARIAS